MIAACLSVFLLAWFVLSLTTKMVLQNQETCAICNNIFEKVSIGTNFFFRFWANSIVFSTKTEP